MSPKKLDANTAVRRGLMFVLSSPSGAGKSTIANLLLKEDSELKLSVSATTRERRSSEVDGVHYHFLKRGDFDKMVAHDELLEWAEVHGNYYGTPKRFVEDELVAGRDVLFDIDVQGSDQLRAKMPDDIATIFILPPSIEEMKSRLKRRAEDSDDVIRRRMKTAVGELKRWPDYDYLVVNEDLDAAYMQVKAILSAERLRQKRQGGNAELAKQLHADLLRETGEDGV
ncbi:MAG: guanylate kinase [Hyphomicrobiales bacterium]